MKKLFQEKPSHGSLSEEFGKTASATHLDIPIAEHHPNNDPFEEVKFVTPFISPSPSFKPKPCPSSHPNVAVDDGQNPTLILHNKSLRNKNFYAMNILLSDTCSYEDPNLLLILIHTLFRRMVVDAFVYHKYCKSHDFTVKPTLQLELQCSMFGGKAGN